MVDVPKFYDPVESLKYIGQVINPTIKHESGITDHANVSSMIDLIKTISIKPSIEKQGIIILDGVYFTLKIGVESTQTTYKWHALPDGWKDLENLANMLIALNGKL